MITPIHQPLWDKIRTFRFDETGVAIPFSAKLAANQQWSADFTLRAIEEYRKFIFLCCISEKGASPSAIVDEVWHLHLTYTLSYWISFCRDTIGQDIHHHPSPGGYAENHRHADWYNETLALYTATFDTPPPQDIWPRQELPAKPPAYRPLWTGAIFLIPFLLIAPFVFIWMQYGILSPFNLPGPQFLIFFPLCCLSLILSYLLFVFERKKEIDRVVEEYFPADATAFQIADLLYGEHRALQAGIVDLVQRGLIEAQGSSNFPIHRSKYIPPPVENNPLVPALLTDNDDTCNYRTMMDRWFDRDKFAHPGLEWLKVYASSYNGFWPYARHLLAPLLVIGVFRVIQGLTNRKPVSYLVLEIIALGLFTGLLATRFSPRKLVYQKIKQLFGKKLPENEYDNSGVLPRFALDGQSTIRGLSEGALLMAIFANSAPREMRDYPGNWFFGNDNSSNGGDSSCGSSSGSSCGSSCGGGSGCGGCGGGGD